MMELCGLSGSGVTVTTLMLIPLLSIKEACFFLVFYTATILELLLIFYALFVGQQ